MCFTNAKTQGNTLEKGAQVLILLMQILQCVVYAAEKSHSVFQTSL